MLKRKLEIVYPVEPFKIIDCQYRIVKLPYGNVRVDKLERIFCFKYWDINLKRIHCGTFEDGSILCKPLLFDDIRQAYLYIYVKRVNKIKILRNIIIEKINKNNV